MGIVAEVTQSIGSWETGSYGRILRTVTVSSVESFLVASSPRGVFYQAILFPVF